MTCVIILITGTRENMRARSDVKAGHNIKSIRSTAVSYEIKGYDRLDVGLPSFMAWTEKLRIFRHQDERRSCSTTNETVPADHAKPFLS